MTELPEILLQEKEISTETGHPWYVRLFDDSVHTFDDVIVQLIKATGCSLPRAEALTWQVHSHGSARVFDGEFEDCLTVSGVLREISLRTEIQG